MARNIPGKQSSKSSEADRPAVPGGSSGLFEEMAVPLGTVGQAVEPSRVDPWADRPTVPVRHFVVRSGPQMERGRIRAYYNGCTINLAPGKIIADNQYDLDLLRRQGIVLEEVQMAPVEKRESGVAVVTPLLPSEPAVTE